MTLKSPAQFAADKRLELMMDAKRALSMAAHDAIAAQRQKVKCNMLEVYGLPRDVREYMAHVDIVLETAVLWAIADGLVTVTELWRTSPEERAERLAEEASAKKLPQNVVPIRGDNNPAINPSAYL